MTIRVNLALLKRVLLLRGWTVCETSGFWMSPDGVLWTVGADGLLTKLG
jgi:hypothetical protein